MYIEEIVAEMQKLKDEMNAYNYSRERDHKLADDLIIEALRLAGRDSGCDEYLKLADLWEECRAEGFYYI